MASSYENTLVDFDLNFLQPCPSNVNVLKHDKQKQSLLNMKKKIVASSALLKKYYTQKERLEETESLLLASKEECKQACIDNKENFEKCTELEKNAVTLKESNQQLAKNIENLQNQVEAMNSHAYQLQTLVKEKESMVEALRIEKELEKNTLKDYETKLTSYEKERQEFLNDIRWFKNVVLGKKKVKEIKHILTKYKDMKVFDHGIESDKSSDVDDFEGCHSRSPSPIDNILCETLGKEHLFSVAKMEPCHESKPYKLKSDKSNDDHDSDFCNEVISEDTGRGSSLSDMNSLENDFMAGDFNIIVKEPIIQVDVGTSPIRIEENCVSSPNIFDDEALLRDQNNDESKPSEYVVSDIKEKQLLVDACTSPIHISHDVVHEGTSPIIFDVVNVDINVIKNLCNRDTDASKSPEYNFSDIPSSSEIVTIKEKQQLVDASTSPIHISHDVVHEGTSPISFEVVNEDINAIKNLCDRDTDPSKSPEYVISDIASSSEIVTIKEKQQLVGACTSPIHISQDVGYKGTSPISVEGNADINVISIPTQVCNREQANTGPVDSPEDRLCPMSVKSLPGGYELEISKKPIEELNGTDVSDDISTDREVQMILGEMKLHHKRISPLPKRPRVHSHKIKEPHGVCQEAIKIREENKSLKTNVDFLCKEIMAIKSLLAQESRLTKNIHTPDDTSLFGDSQQTIVEADKDSSTVVNHIEVNNTCEASTDFELRSNATCETDPISLNLIPQNKILFDEYPITTEADINCTNSFDNHIETTNHSKDTNNDFSKHNKLSNSRFKRRKQTKLDLLKRNMIPKSKMRVQLPERVKKIPIKRIVRKDMNDKLLDIINNKEAYDKARRVMVELKSKEISEPKILKQKKVKKREDRSNIRNISDIAGVQKEDLLKKPALMNDIAKDKSSNNEHKILSPKNNEDTTSSKLSLLFTDNKINYISISDEIVQNSTNLVKNQPKEGNTSNMSIVNDESVSVNVSNETAPKTNRRRKRIDSDSSNVSYKRMLRSSKLEKNDCTEKPENEEYREVNIDYNDLDMFDTNENVNDGKSHLDQTTDKETDTNILNKAKRKRVSSNNSDTQKRLLRSSNSHVSNTNIDRNENAKDKSHERLVGNENNANNLSNNILCNMIKRYGRNIIRTSASKVSDKTIGVIFAKIDTTLSDIVEEPPDKLQKALDHLITYLKALNRREFISGLMKYLQDPARKLELYNKAITKVPMTKKEQMVVYIIKQMNDKNDLLNDILRNIDFALFCLSRNPEFDTIESLSHLYAVLCRVFHLKNRLKVFMLDAMYCLNFKAVVVVKQCLTTWPHVLPLAHLPHAKSPLVLSVVYLLHFLKCDNRGMKRAQDIRWLLDKKYMYNFNDWNQNGMLEIFSNAIKTVREEPAERNMLRMAIIIFAKRQGVKWCQRHIINNLLLPYIESENTPERVKIFCIKVLGPLFKAYPINMKVHCEIITNRLLDMLEQENLSHAIKEGIFTSLICMSKHNPQRVNSALLKWSPDGVSSEFEALIKSYVREKPIKAWKKILSKTN